MYSLDTGSLISMHKYQG